MLITGMSGTGKSTALEELRRRGHEVHEGDDGWIDPGSDATSRGPGAASRRWRVEAVRALLDRPRAGAVYLAGCEEGQAELVELFEAIALLSVPLEVALARVTERPHPYGSTAGDRAAITRDTAGVEPLLRAVATREIDTRRSVAEVADELEWLASGRLWRPGTPGLLRLPSGRLVRGRSWRRPYGERDRPALSLRFAGRPPRGLQPGTQWVPWADFRPPRDREQARTLLIDAWRRSATERVEVTCRGGRGRTGTALASLLVLDGVAADEAIATVRSRYHQRAVETRGQRRFVSWLAAQRA